MLARRDGGLIDSLGRNLDNLLRVRRGDFRASTPTNDGGMIPVPGDFREIRRRLGFLTDISVDNMIATIGAILDGRFVAEERMLLEGKVQRGGKQVFEGLAFNDVVVSKGVAGSMLTLEARVDGQFIYNQRADGLIVATPTGSTAYALSSGGPILHPSLSVIALVPLSPHTLSNRPIVISSECTVEIIVRDNPEPRVHFDSHSRCELRADDRIVVRRYARPLSLLHPEGHSYYNMLRLKLNWNRE